MTTVPGELHAHSVGCDALPQPSHGDADDRALGAVDGPGERALVGGRQALRASELANGIVGRSGAQI